eukprot:884188-Pyramimonas_sp.AAC.3
MPRALRPCVLWPGQTTRIAAVVRDHPLSHPLRCRGSGTPAVAWTTGAHSGRAHRQLLAHPYGVEQVQRLLCLDAWGA